MNETCLLMFSGIFEIRYSRYRQERRDQVDARVKRIQEAGTCIESCVDLGNVQAERKFGDSS